MRMAMSSAPTVIEALLRLKPRVAVR